MSTRDRFHRKPDRLPERHEIPAGGYLVYLAPEDEKPDGFNRVLFMAFWWDEHYHEGPRVRGQVFRADLDNWERHRTVKRWDGK